MPVTIPMLEAEIARLRAEMERTGIMSIIEDRDRLRGENERLRQIIKGAEIALARDEDVPGAMRCLLQASARGQGAQS